MAQGQEWEGTRRGKGLPSYLGTGSHGSGSPLDPCSSAGFIGMISQVSTPHTMVLLDLPWRTGYWEIKRTAETVSVFNLPKKSKAQSFTNTIVMEAWKGLCERIWVTAKLPQCHCLLSDLM